MKQRTSRADRFAAGESGAAGTARALGRTCPPIPGHAMPRPRRMSEAERAAIESQRREILNALDVLIPPAPANVSADPTSAGQTHAAVAPPCHDLPAGLALPAPPAAYARFFANGALALARQIHLHQVKPCLATI